jgi:protein-S-isoprenylcysteine O-methyltransferase Ste14
MGRRVFAVLRSLFFSTLFIALWTYFVPLWIVGRGAFAHPRPWAWLVVAIGAVIGLPCVWEFAWRGLGTPAPFDPPRRLVISGPYRWVRNPMYVGMGIALVGEAIVFPNVTTTLLILVVVLWVAVTFLIVGFEEPTLRRMFGSDYERYCQHVRRWIPRLKPFDNVSSAAVQ